MTLSLGEQYQTAIGALAGGDLDLIETMLLEPGSVTTDEMTTISKQLGMKGDLLSFATNFITDPLVLASFFLQRRFPTSQFLRGVVPRRFIGTNNEFTGVSTVARTVEGFFRGTNVPKLIGLKMQREVEVLNVGNKIFDKILARGSRWTEEMPIVSQLLEGVNPAGATPELRTVAGGIRTHMNELWGFLRQTQKISGGFSDGAVSRSVAENFPTNQAPKFLRDFLPHMPLTTNESIIQTSGREALSKFAKSKSSQALLLQGEDPSKIWSLGRTDDLTSNYFDFQRFLSRTQGQVFNPRLFRRIRHGQVLESPEGKELFVTDLNVILQKYVHGVARTFALNAPLSSKERALASTLIEGRNGQVQRITPTGEPIITQIINQGLEASSSGRFIKQQIAGTNIFRDVPEPSTINHPSMGALKSLVRSVMGQRGEDEILFGNLMGSMRTTLSRMGGAISKKDVLRTSAGIDSLERRQKDRDLINRTTSFFYATTLGLNPLSAMKNLFQPFLTTAPSIGIGPTLAGYQTLRRRFPVYGREFINQKNQLAGQRMGFVQKMNLAQERAFNKVFPEIAKAGIKIDPRAFELDEASLVTDALGSRKFSNFDDHMKFLLQPFTQTEASNQIVTFYGSKQALRNAVRMKSIDLPALPNDPAGRSVALDDFLNFEASSIVSATQFRPGPGSRTVLQSHIPAPFRMFTSFPVRLANHFSESTVRGAMLDSQLQGEKNLLTRFGGGRNFGTLARTLLIGKGVTDGLREAIGVDISDAVGITGPFTGIAPPGRLLSPLPVSPLPSVIFSVASFASTRDLRDLQPVELPGIGRVPFPKLLVPGGVALSRASRALNQFRPDLGGFVDENERLKVEGDTTDLVLAMLGIPLEKDRRQRQQMDILSQNKRRITEFRRAFAMADRNFDLREQDNLQQRYAKEFPQFGPLVIADKDRRRYREQAQMTSVQRMLTSLGRKASFLESSIMDIEPDLIAN